MGRSTGDSIHSEEGSGLRPVEHLGLDRKGRWVHTGSQRDFAVIRNCRRKARRHCLRIMRRWQRRLAIVRRRYPWKRLCATGTAKIEVVVVRHVVVVVCSAGQEQRPGMLNPSSHQWQTFTARSQALSAQANTHCGTSQTEQSQLGRHNEIRQHGLTMNE